MADGQITDVDVVEYPTGNGKDQEINAYALPDPGAGDPRRPERRHRHGQRRHRHQHGYVQSLQSALDQAGV